MPAERPGIKQTVWRSQPPGPKTTIDQVETPTSAALVRHTGTVFTEVINALGGRKDRWLAGHRTRILDGSHLPGTEHRIAPLRTTRAGALPGQSLVVFEPLRELVPQIDVAAVSVGVGVHGAVDVDDGVMAGVDEIGSGEYRAWASHGGRWTLLGRAQLDNDGRSLIIAEGPELATPPDQLQVTLEPVGNRADAGAAPTGRPVVRWPAQ